MHSLNRIIGAVAAAFTLGAASAADTAQVLAWNGIALEAVANSKLTQHQVVRTFAHLSLAQYLAASEGADDVVLATASMRVIAALLPAQADAVAARHRAMHPQESDRGRRIAERVLADAATDGFERPANVAVPNAAYVWRSLANPPLPPAYPAIGAMRTFFIASGEAFRATPPPALASERFHADLAQTRRFADAPTDVTTRIAKFYDMTTGTMAGGYWNERAAAAIHASTLDAAQAAIVLVTLNGAMLDALIACHDSKYVYWVPRPSQADPSLKPLIGVPNHPSYPSNHSCLSTAAARVLGHFFPSEREAMERAAVEAGLSRIYAGIHYRFDVEAGETIGRKVGDAALAEHARMLAERRRAGLGASARVE